MKFIQKVVISFIKTLEQKSAENNVLRKSYKDLNVD